MDHGLEAAGEREAKGKDPRGRILIRFSIENGSLLMDYQDDGRGLDLDRVQKKADELGMTKHQKARNPHELAQLIFAPGFSTKGEASMISGRGIGMDAVRLLVEESGGEIALILDHPTIRLQTFHLRASWSLDTLLNLVA